MGLSGRQVIYTDQSVITRENVLSVLEKAIEKHRENRCDIQYLFDYYKGKQPILQRQKDYRPEICNRIVENRANEIVSFKVGYLMGEPVQYVRRSAGNEDLSEEINRLNDYIFAEDKASKDKELADWFTICGTSFRMVLPRKDAADDEAPFRIFTLDPRNTFVVYYSGLGNDPVMGVYYVVLEDNSQVYSVYTKDRYFEIKDDSTGSFTVTKDETHFCGDIPIVEYPANPSRLGAFEIVLPLLDAINTVSSNRIDGVEQFIQSLLVLKGVDIDDEDFKSLKENGGLKIPSDGDAKYLTQELNQTQTQTLVDYLDQAVLVICGMPNRNGGSSTSDTGSAVIMRDGWSDAEARAKDTELMFKCSEKRFLRMVLRFTEAFRDLSLRVSAIEIRFTRRNYENIQAKAQVLTTLLACDKVHPELSFSHSGLFTDPQLAYEMSRAYAEEQKAEAKRELDEYAVAETKRAQAATGNQDPVA